MFRIQLGRLDYTPGIRRPIGRPHSRGRGTRRRVPLLELCEQRVVLSTSTWIGGAHVDSSVTSGDPQAWSNPLNWLGGVPGAGDTAEFTANVNFTLPNHNGGPAVSFSHPFNESPKADFNNSTTISVDSAWSGSITVESAVTLTLAGGSQWNGGTLATVSGGTLVNASGATLTLQNPSLVDVSGTLTNQGILNVDGSAPIQMAGATINNEAGGTFDIQSNEGLSTDNSLIDAFTNSGLLEQTVAAGTTDFRTSLSNTGGTIDIQTGTFEWDGDSGVSTGGTFDASPGAVLQYGVGNQSNTWTGTYTGGGSGGQFDQGTPNGFDAEIAVGSSGITFNFKPGFYQWQSGDIAPAGSSANVTNLGTITLAGPVPTSEQGLMLLNAGVTLDNQGTIDQSGAGNFVFRASALINESTGVFDFQSDTGWNGFGNLTGTVTNKGLIEKTATTGQSVINVLLDNQGGTLDVESGTLIPWNDSGSVSTGGTFTIASGATLQYNAGGNSSNTFTGTYTTQQASGFGQFVLNSDNLVVGTGGATFDFPSGFFQWIGGGQLTATAGTLTNTGFITVDTSNGGNATFAGTLNNQATITVQNTGNNTGFFSGGTVNNPAAGIININGIDGTAHGTPLLNTTINNSGTINRVVNTGLSSIAVLNNTGGTLDVQAGTLIPWNGFGSVSTGGILEAATGATILYNNGGNTNNTFTGTYTGSGGGQFVLNSDVLTVGSGGATFDFPSGFFQWIGGGQLTATAGTLTNTGFITVDTSNGGNATFAGTLNNQATITVQNTGNNTGFFSGGTVNNPAAGIININGIDGTAHGTPLLNTTINNSGTINRVVNTGLSSIAVLNNTGGTLDVQAGTLIPWNGFGSVSTGGILEAATGATILYNNGGNTNNTFTGTYTGSGGGQFVLNSDVLTIGTGGATFDFPSGFFQWIGGGQLTATAGTLTNTGFITVDTSNGGNATFAGTLNNQATITVQNTGNNTGFFSGGTVNNPAAGIININGIDGTAHGTPLLNTTINNSGTINRVVNTGLSSIAVLNNTGGTLDVQAGTLIPWNGFGSVSTGGILEAATGATILYNNGGNTNNTFTGTYTGSGGGQFVLNSDVLTVGTGGATFDFPSGFFQWIGGGQLTATAGTLTNSGFITVDTSDGGNATFAGTLNNQATITVQNTGNNTGFFSGGTVNNQSSGIINIDGIDGTAHGTPLLNTTVNNAGAITANSSTTATINSLNNTGSVTVQSGTLHANSVAQISSGSLTGGTWDVLGGSTLNLQNGVLLTTNNAIVLLDGARSNFANFVNKLAINGGSFTVQDGATFTTPGALGNTGVVIVGNNGSILTVTGNFTQSGAASQFEFRTL